MTKKEFTLENLQLYVNTATEYHNFQHDCLEKIDSLVNEKNNIKLNTTHYNEIVTDLKNYLIHANKNKLRYILIIIIVIICILIFTVHLFLGILGIILSYFIYPKFNTINEDIKEFGWSEYDNFENLTTRQKFASQLNKFPNNFNEKFKHFENEAQKNYTNKIKSIDEKLNLLVSKINSTLKENIPIFNYLPQTSFNLNNDLFYTNLTYLLPYYCFQKTVLSIEINNKFQKIEIPRLHHFWYSYNRYINCESKEDFQNAKQIVNHIITTSLLTINPKLLHITIIDPEALGANAKDYTTLNRNIVTILSSQEREIELKLSSLIRNIERINNQCLQKKYENLLSYNIQNEENPEKFNLVIVYNLLNCLNANEINNLKIILKSGLNAGVFCLIINDANSINFKREDRLYFYDIQKLVKINEEFIEYNNISIRNETISLNDIVIEKVNKNFNLQGSDKISFTKYLLDDDEWWRERTHDKFEIQIGKSGNEIQNLTFSTIGESKSNALLIGKPGSGKSNLLHVLIANSLCKYSPDELEIYLIDFKGGVEFVTYADYYIPHIRAIAIDSEREFGLSVLEKVEKEMLDRQKLFNQLSIQNLVQYSNNNINNPLPRILLIVDEFQKFYTENDYIKNKVNIILDNIIKQGRAFGINILFSSQTLTGDTILPSTRNLFEIRIALMCSENDQQIIFEENNKSAKDLVNSGDGIYNDKMGKNGYNKKFKAFYVEDDRSNLNILIKNISNYSKSILNQKKLKSQIIFRSSELALIEKSTLNNFVPAINSNTYFLWLGQPIAIDDDVKAVFKKQGGSNLLIVGTDDNLILKMIFTVIVSLMKQSKNNGNKFFLFNGNDSDTISFKSLENIVNVAKSKSFLFNSYEEQETKNALLVIKKEIDERILNRNKKYPTFFVILSSIQRIRIFRKTTVATEETKLLTFIIKEGSNVGVHVILNIDSYNTISNKIFESGQQFLNEFSQRIVTQISKTESTTIISTDKGFNLGNNRAYYYWETENKFQKFKPFELPTKNWFVNNL